MTELLRVRDLSVTFPTDDGDVHAVDGLDLTVRRGETLGIVGESGSGKSVTSLAVMGLLDGARQSGEIWLGEQELLSAPAEQIRELRGKQMAMIFQDSLSALHPFYSVGKQIAEAYRVHHPVEKKVARKRAIEMLDRVGIPEPAKRAGDYPNQFSGGMRQRVMIAMALVNDPDLIIADEPTTALDVTVQAQILELIAGVQSEFGSAVILITHDLGVVADVADSVLIMYAGRAAESGTVREIFHEPHHPYAWGLLGSTPRLDRPRTQRLQPVTGTPPSLIRVPSGCPFHPRCPYPELVGGDRCRTERPPLLPVGGDHLAACHLPEPEKQRIWQEVRAEL
ncbi:MAG TPA: ABC transporter ATP-binding protein [Mycobacteriales bacterium]|nr:ABC transporter ATP-binding protein [Mycobacteriales bacterium]